MSKQSTPSVDRPAGSIDTADVPHIGTADPLVAEWRKVLTLHATVSCALENELQKRHGIGLSEFETLDRLMDTHTEKYRMSELAEDTHLSQSALSRTVARLEKDGLVERGMCDFDRRAIFLCVTDQGRAVHTAATPTHREVLARTLH